MIILNRKGDTDPVTQPVAIEGAHGEVVVLTPFVARVTASDRVEEFGVGTQDVAKPKQGRLRINIPGVVSVVIK